jgi:hypothetical protein
MTVKENLNRIVFLEDDVKDLDNRLSAMEIRHSELVGRLDAILKMSRIILSVCAASLGLDGLLEGGMI